VRRLPGALAIAGPVAFTVAWLIAWAAQDSYSPRREDMSALAAIDARHPWIMMIGFLALAVGLLALAAGLRGAQFQGRGARIAMVLIGLAGIGVLIAGLARNDCSSQLPACKALVDAGDVSWHHSVHDAVSGLVFLALVVAELALGRSFRSHAGWQDLWLYSVVSGVLTLALLVAFASEASESSNGLIQRIFLAVPMLWMVTLGWRLLNPVKSGSSTAG
jgi:hypothetical membrane protein